LQKWKTKKGAKRKKARKKREKKITNNRIYAYTPKD
jgi:hypothetical protein